MDRIGVCRLSYYVHEDDATSMAKVHLGACSFCNHGRGMKDTRLPDNRWHGPFPDRESANGRARATRKRDVAECKVCLD